MVMDAAHAYIGAGDNLLIESFENWHRCLLVATQAVFDECERSAVASKSPHGSIFTKDKQGLDITFSRVFGCGDNYDFRHLAIATLGPTCTHSGIKPGKPIRD